MPKKLVLLGGGHAHLHVLAHLSDYLTTDIQVTLISPRTFWYSGMGPGMLGGFYSRADATVDMEKLVSRAGADFIDAMAESFDPPAGRVRLTDGRTVHFDVLSLNLGSGINQRAIPGYEYATTVKPVSNLHRLHEQLDMVRPKQLSVVVIGGGLAGIEIAGNLAMLLTRIKTDWNCILLAGRRGLAAGLPQRFVRQAERELTRLGVTVMAEVSAIDISPESVLLDSDERLESQLTILATGVQPPEIVADSGVTVDSDGAMVVTPTLQSVSHPNIFGGGDCISLMGRNLARTGVYAVRQGPILRHNLRAFFAGTPMRHFRPQKQFLLIANLGNRRALGSWRGFTFGGKKTLWLKQYLDRKFMAGYQGSG